MSHERSQPPTPSPCQEHTLVLLQGHLAVLDAKVHDLERDIRGIQDTLHGLGEALVQASRAFS